MRIPDQVSVYWGKYRATLLSVILCVYSLPQFFFLSPGSELDGSWTRAINMAVNKHLVFGRDIVFTYGPLGFLHTRNTQYLGNVLLLLGDLFLVTGFFYIARKFLSKYERWFFILLAAFLCFKGSGYTQALFFVFVIFSVFNIQNNFKSHFELIYCTLAGVIVFYVKVNYGIIALGILALMVVLQLARYRNGALITTLIAVIGLWAIHVIAHVDVINYIRYSLPLIAYYDEAMFTPKHPVDVNFYAAMVSILVFLGIVAFYLFGLLRLKLEGKWLPIFLLSGLCFLIYKNGFTRFDFEHFSEFYSIFPLFVIFSLLSMDYGKYLVVRVLSVGVLVISMLILTPGAISLDSCKRYFSYSLGISVRNYFTAIGSKQEELVEIQLSADKLKLINDATIDIIPKQIVLLQLNHLNYHGRPVIQSYTVYSKALDSLNATFFRAASRPELVMIRHDGIDDRYFFWDESLTKATLQLNYDYSNYISLNNDCLSASNNLCYLLLKSIKTEHKKPEFEKIGEQTIDFGERVNLNFPDSVPVYMTMEMHYSAIGKVQKLFYQPPLAHITLSPEGLPSVDYRVVKQILEGPVLINKFIANNIDLKNFMTGHIKDNKNIKGFVVYRDGDGFERKLKVTFFSFKNYRRG